MSETLNRELIELKAAIKGYQQELDAEKQRYGQHVDNLTEELD
jgi:hypothetical protein